MKLRFLTQHFGWKVASLALSVLLWFIIVGQPEVLTSRAVPVLYQNVPPDLLVTGDVQDTVRVELRGTSGKLTTSSLADVVMLLDLSGVAGPGDRTYTISSANLNLPATVTFLRAIPSQLRVRLARMLRKEVPVQIRFTGAVPPGYRLTGQQVRPETLPIAGSEERVLGISEVQTDPIDLSSITQAAELRVNTFVADPRVHLDSSPIVTVKITVEKTGN